MERAPRKHKASKSASKDIISRMPKNVIMHILDRLPIQYAVRTSILSSNWRFKWTLLSKVVSDDKFYEYLKRLGRENWYDELNIAITTSLVFHLVGHFSKLQELYLDLRMCKFLGELGAEKWVRTSFRCLKTLVLYPIDFSSDIKLSFAFEMIWGSPELPTLIIVATYNDAIPPPAFCSSALNHISMGQLKLRIVELKSFGGSENEIYLIKNLLACSPALKKIVIFADPSQIFGGENGKLMFATKLLEFHRASTAAQVKIYWS
ncbi:FBD-associated F-box protein At5g22730-like [Rutidosis leptorrhynchoides]|uniref:FBD-associated F-box protein At5g22730-like n=1 Tax=Rutidosis leptorrhynchoides TaxID=125765 RepID=UPI003A99506C